MLKWLLLATLFLAACTDYLGEFKDEYGSLASVGVDDDHGVSSESRSTLLSSTGATPMSSSSSVKSNSTLTSSASATPVSGGSFSKSSSSSYATGYFWSASADACGDLWCGRLKEYRVITGFDAGDDCSGYWYDYNDESDGGNSRVDFPVGGREDDGGIGPTIIDECGGICGTMVLDKGASYYALAGVGFNVAGQYEESADVTSWGGLCVVYSSACHICLELGMGHYDFNLSGDVPCAPLQPGTGIVQDFEWSDFKQQGWSDTYMTGDDAAKRLVSLKFRFLETEYSVDQLYCEFNIKSIGKYGTCN